MQTQEGRFRFGNFFLYTIIFAQTIFSASMVRARWHAALIFALTWVPRFFSLAATVVPALATAFFWIHRHHLI